MPLANAEDALARLDERLAKSPIRDGWIARTHFADACAALWLEGLARPYRGSRAARRRHGRPTPTHDLIRAHAVLRARRRIADAEPDWALSTRGYELRGRGREAGQGAAGAKSSGAGGLDEARRRGPRRVRGRRVPTTRFSPTPSPRSTRQWPGRAEPSPTTVFTAPCERDPLVHDPTGTRTPDSANGARSWRRPAPCRRRWKRRSCPEAWDDDRAAGARGLARTAPGRRPPEEPRQDARPPSLPARRVRAPFRSNAGAAATDDAPRHRPRSHGRRGEGRARGARPLAYGAHRADAKARRPPSTSHLPALIEYRPISADRLGRHGREGTRGHAARGADDGCRARPARGDRTAALSGLGHLVEETSVTRGSRSPHSGAHTKWWGWSQSAGNPTFVATLVSAESPEAAIHSRCAPCCPG